MIGVTELSVGVELSPLQLMMLALAGVLAGSLNAVAGGGTYFTFPLLIGAGLPPILANTTNKVGIWIGSLGSVGGYWSEVRSLAGQRLWLFVGSAITGSVAGSLLLLVTPSAAFGALVPWLMLSATVLFAGGPRVTGWLERRAVVRDRAWPGTVRYAGQFAVGVYGGFFGAGMAILLMAMYELMGIRGIHRINALKALVALAVNAVSVLIFVVVGSVHWPAGAALMAGGLVGGGGGATLAKRMPEPVIRWCVIAFASGATVWCFLQ